MKALHPGEILRLEFMEPHGMDHVALANAMGISAGLVSDVLNERTGISPPFANGLALVFGTTPEFWLNLHRAWMHHRRCARSVSGT